MRALALSAVLLSACASESTGITAADLECPADSTLTYANFGSALLADNCLSCHATQQAPALTTQAQVQANRVAIIGAAVTSARMPKSGSISDEERALLGEWLTCGAP